MSEIIRYVIEAYKPSGKYYTEATVEAEFHGRYTSAERALRILSPEGLVPGLVTFLDSCPYFILLRPATEADADAAMRVGAPCVPHLVMPTRKDGEA